MEDRELRFHCVEVASRTNWHGGSPKGLVETAQMLYDFIVSQQKPDCGPVPSGEYKVKQ